VVGLRVVPRASCRKSLFELPSSVLAECGEGVRVQRHPASTGVRLRARLERRLGADEAESPMHGDATCVEVDVVPSESGHLAAPHPRRGEQQPGGVQAIRLDVQEESPYLRRRPPSGSFLAR
jgi:hypothetical protein